jgi:thioredoxin-related protein
MKYSLFRNQFIFVKTLFLMLLLTLVNASFAAPENKTKSNLHSFPEWFDDSPFLDLEEAISEGSNEGKKGLMILFTTQGCSYCEQFIRDSLGDPKIAALVQEKFSSLGLEIFDDAEMVTPTGETMAVKHFAKKEGVGFAPTLLFYDNQGKRVLRQVGYQAPQRFLHLMDYVAENHYQSQNLRDFIISKQVKNPTAYAKLRSDKLFDEPPYALDRSHFDASEPLMVLFEKKGCNECEDFHRNVMQLKHVRETLNNFQIVRMDVDDEKTPVLLPNGKFTTPSSWFTQTSFSRLPALMFFDEKGKQALKTDALVRDDRMMNSLNYMLEKAHLKNWTYQQFARSKAIEKSQQQAVSQSMQKD